LPSEIDVESVAWCSFRHGAIACKVNVRASVAPRSHEIMDSEGDMLYNGPMVAIHDEAISPDAMYGDEGPK
jgi:hypothetical protein